MSEENKTEDLQEDVVESSTEETKQNEEGQKDSKKSKWGGIIKECLIYALMFVCILYLVPNYVCARTVVDGTSMRNTLQDRDSVLLDKISYRFVEPKRFDVVVFYHFNDFNNQDKSDSKAYDFYVKRVIGLPGETVQLKLNEDGITYSIYINGERLEENYGKDPIEDPGRMEEPVTLGEDEYFVLGDNREVSIDSRYEDVGNVKKDWIAGRVRFRIAPIKDMKVVK